MVYLSVKPSLFLLPLYDMCTSPLVDVIGEVTLLEPQIFEADFLESIVLLLLLTVSQSLLQFGDLKIFGEISLMRTSLPAGA